MKYIEKDLGNIKKTNIIPISDLHISDPNFNEDKCKRTIEYIKNEENTFVILDGDILNCATKGSVSDIYGELQNPQQAKKYAFNLLKPIKDKILCSVTGNHEFRTYKESGVDIAEDLAMMLDVEYANEGALLNIKLGNNGPGRYNYTIYCSHGAASGKTIGGKSNALKRMSDIIQAEIFIMGHTHQIQTFTDYIYSPDTTHHKIIKQKRLYINSGSFLEWGGYSERFLLTPSKTGVPRLFLSGERKDFHCSI